MRIRADFGRSALQGFVSSSLWLTTVGGGPCRADGLDGQIVAAPMAGSRPSPD